MIRDSGSGLTNCTTSTHTVASGADGSHNTKTRVVLADDYPLLRFGIRTLIEREKDLLLCGIAGSPEETLETIATSKPDVAIIAFSLKITATFALIKEARLRHVRTPLLVLSYKDDPALARRVSRSGAKGFIARADAAECVIEAIRRMAQGLTYVGAKASSTLADQMFSASQDSSIDGLTFTDREQEILELIGSGLTPREIAEVLRLSIKTVESHRENIKQKLGIRNAAKLVPYAFQWLQSRRHN